jgi:putative phosphoesterase
MKLGVISDTHGLLRPEAVEALRGSDYIIHAGDIGAEDIIPTLQAIAPVSAIRGNVDHADWTKQYPFDDFIELDGHLIYVIHDVSEINISPLKANVGLVISGHSHKPGINEQNGVIYLNPGSAGPRRFKLPISVATVEITKRKIIPQIHELIPIET